MSLAETMSTKEQEEATVAHRDLRGFMETLDAQGQLMQVRDELLPEPDVRGNMRADSAAENWHQTMTERSHPKKMVVGISGASGSTLDIELLKTTRQQFSAGKHTL